MIENLPNFQMSNLSPFTPALTLAKWIRQRRISPLELTQFYLQRIEQFDSQIGSFHHVAVESALKDAQRKTEYLAQCPNPEDLPPFFGVPTAIKDLNAVAGMPCRYGVSFLADNIPHYDEAIVSKIKGAGFILLGKTATSQLGSFPYTEPPHFPPTRNPWHLDYTPGGSSGGAAAAVAAGLCPIAQGSDGGGSIRTPAVCCGLVGIKPSRGRVSYAPIGDYQNGIASNGTLGRTVADAAALLDVISGYVVGDPYWLPEPTISFLESTQQSLPSLHIAIADTIYPFPSASPPIQATLQKVGKQLESLGHHLETVVFQAADGLIEPFRQIWQAGVAASGLPLEMLSPLNQYLAKQTDEAGEYLRAVKKMQVISRTIVAFFQQYDVLLLPVNLHAPIRIGEWDHLSPELTIEQMINWVAPCPPFNASGLPAIAFPVGLDEQGLPIGVQLVGKPAQETVLISLVAKLEEMRGLLPEPSL